MRTLVLLLLAGLAPTGPAQTGARPDSVDLAVYDVTVVDVESGSALAGRDVEVDAGRIVVVRPADPSQRAPARHVLDGAGRFLIPGLWDMPLQTAGKPLV